MDYRKALEMLGLQDGCTGEEVEEAFARKKVALMREQDEQRRSIVWYSRKVRKLLHAKRKVLMVVEPVRPIAMGTGGKQSKNA